jgi:hypothetical protein
MYSLMNLIQTARGIRWWNACVKGMVALAGKRCERLHSTKCSSDIQGDKVNKIIVAILRRM